MTNFFINYGIFLGNLRNLSVSFRRSSVRGEATLGFKTTRDDGRDGGARSLQQKLQGLS